MKNLIKSFNRADTHLVISDYPEKSLRGEKNYGIAWYTKELVDSLAKYHGVKSVVLAHRGFTNKPEIHENNKILVLRVFDNNHHSLFPRILRWLMIFNNISTVHVHSEFSADGGLKNYMLLIPFLLLIRLTGKKIIYYNHNVITDFQMIAQHLNIDRFPFLVFLLNQLIGIYYRLLNIITHNLVVMDESILNKLMLYIKQDKIILNPFWVHKPTHIPNEKTARKNLHIQKNEFVLLFFGFITHYKGADWLIETMTKINKLKKFKHIRLILAGGKAYSLKNKTYYQKYYYDLLKKIKNTKISITGFVPEQKIAQYFQASDLVVFPYRGLIGSSASLIHAISYHKPFILSQPMEQILLSEDFQKSLNENKLTLNDVVFEHTYISLKNKLEKYMDNKNTDKLISLSNSIARKRDFKIMLANCYKNLFNQKNVEQKLKIINPVRLKYA